MRRARSHCFSDIAIVGMACVFPGAADLAAYWGNLEAGRDLVGDVPPGRWDDVFFDPSSMAPDRVYCRRGGFIEEPRFDPLAFGVMPVAAAGAEPDQMLTLQVAAAALADAGYDQRPFAREKTGVILGRGGYMGVGMTRFQQHVRAAEQLVGCLRALLPGLPESDLDRVRAEFRAGSGPCGPEVAFGQVPNLAASRVAHWLDLHGPAHTVDAACASSLVAVDQACRELHDGRCDLVLAGGVHLGLDVTFWSVFCQLDALSRSQQIRPFDRRADGLLIGEGVGIVALKRRADAEPDGDRVYALIRGVGMSSDGRGTSLMNPRIEGQLLALERAWGAAGLDPATVGLLEAHGTGTPAGDAAELSTLARFFGPARPGERRVVLGSVKSMIGHAMPAAGAAGLIKAALAVHHGVLLPTLHCEEPHELLSTTRFRTLDRSEPWVGQGHRRAGVNAFGFGGVNVHVVLEAPRDGRLERRADPRPAHSPKGQEGEPPLPALLALAAADVPELLERLEAEPPGDTTQRGSGPCRLALLDPTPERRARARAVVGTGRPWRGHDGIWFAPRGLVAEGGRIAFLFPGVDAVVAPRIDDVATRFGLPVFVGANAPGLEEGGLGVIGVNRLFFRVLVEMGLRPDVLAGHSIGEWNGMIASGMIAEEAVDAFLETVRPGTLRVPDLVFAAAGCGAARAAVLVGGTEGVYVSHDNCPHQVILCGHEDAIEAAAARLRAHGILCQRLPFRSGFHSPLFRAYLEPHRENLSRFALRPPEIPLWSATTCAPYPEAPEAVRALFLDHLVSPVRFRELVEALYGAGVRVFVQAGAGSLPGFVEDTLRGRPHHAVSANVAKRSGLAQLQRLAAALFVEGLEPDLAALSPRPRGKAAGRGKTLRLPLNVPLVPVLTPLRGPPLSTPPAARRRGDDGAGEPVLAAFAASFEEIATAQAEVQRVWEAAARREAEPTLPGPVVRRRVLSLETAPYLIDHCFYPQPAGWPSLADRRPVVPMTTLIALMIETATELAPGRVAVAVERVRSDRWLEVVPAAEVDIRARFEAADRVHVAVGDDIEGTVVLAAARPPRPLARTAALAQERAARITAGQLYTEGWMFHGPAFQTVAELGPLGRDGVNGVLVAGEAPGSLLDGAGQLLGYWVMAQAEEERLAMPVSLERVETFGEDPAPGQRLDAAIRIRRLGPGEVAADMELSSDGRAVLRVQDWRDRRFYIDDRLWPILRRPERHLLSTIRPEGYSFFHDTYRSAFTRDYLAWRFLGKAERAVLDALGPRRRRDWLAGRIAAKDAVRALLWARGYGPVFPVEVEVWNEPGGRPRVRGPFREDLRVSIAHCGEVAVALAADGQDVGIDVERIEARPPEFWDVCFTEAERRMIDETEDQPGEATRVFAAKEAVAKSRGEGLGGNPRRLEVTEWTESALRFDGRLVESRREGDYFVCWTVS